MTLIFMAGQSKVSRAWLGDEEDLLGSSEGKVHVNFSLFVRGRLDRFARQSSLLLKLVPNIRSAVLTSLDHP